MKNLLHILLLLVVSGALLGQTTAHISRNTFSIGEQVEVVYELRLETIKDRVKFQPKIGLMPCSELIRNSALGSGKKVSMELTQAFKDTITEKKGDIRWIGTYRMTSWDTGYFEIPAARILFNDSTLEFDAIPFSVNAPAQIEGKDIFESEDEFLDLHADEFFWLKKNAWWIITLVVLAVVALIYTRKRKAPEPPERKELSLKSKTLLAIDALEDSRLWEKGMLKEHYIELSYIIRSYLSARYELNLLERTSYQTTVLLIKLGLAQDTVQTIQLILDQSDMVKFAKSAPAEKEVLKISALARQIVAETSPLEFNYAE